MVDTRQTEIDTVAHIVEVQRELGRVITNLTQRAFAHDASKLQEPELTGFASLTTKLKDVTFGTPEYAKALEEAKPVIEEHYKKNDHHPEHHVLGVADMNLMQIIEMLCDWKAASLRTKDGNIWKSIDFNTKRFYISDQLRDVLENTAEALWGPRPADT